MSELNGQHRHRPHRNAHLFPEDWEAPPPPAEQEPCGTGRFVLILVLAAVMGVVAAIAIVASAWLIHQAAIAGLVR